MNRTIWIVGLVGTLVACAYVSIILASHSWNPTIMLAEGVDAPVQADYASRLLEIEVQSRDYLGHDGKFFFILANDPFLLDPSSHATYLDFPTYRAQRILYPLVAGGIGLFSPLVTAWGLIVVNLIASGVGSASAAVLARSMRASPWLGLSFVVNPGIIAEIDIDGGGVLAVALSCLALWLFQNRSHWAAVACFAASALTRETMLLFVFGVFLWVLRRQRRADLPLLMVPGLAVVSWRLYVGARLSGLETPGETGESLSRNFDPFPLRGLASALPSWVADAEKLLWSICLIVLIALFVRRAWKSTSLLAWSCAPFVILAMFLSVIVWREPYDIARAVSPIFLCYPILLFSRAEEMAGVRL